MQEGARPRLSMVVLFCWAASWQTARSAPTRTPVLPPTNLVMTSYNFNTTLSWDYQDTSFTPRFTVEIRYYISGKTSVVKACRNISEHFCDLSKNVKNPKDSYWGRVKAIVGAEESPYAESAAFSLPFHGKIGPPALHVSMEGDQVVIEVYHPPTPFKNLTLLDIYEDFNYILYFGNKEIEFEEEECDIEACGTEILLPQKVSNICVSAEGKSKHWMVPVERSEEKCLDVINSEANKDQTYQLAMILVFSIVAVILTILAVLFVFKVLQERNISLPKSLALFGQKTGTSTGGSESPSNSEQVFPVSVVERAPLIANYPKLPPEPPELLPEKDISKNLIETSNPSVSHENEEQSEGYAAPDLSSGSSEKDKYFQSDKSTAEIESCTENPRPNLPFFDLETSENPSRNVVSQSFGYDKPHVPLSLSTEGDEGM
ncbi:interferon gamma receptor 1 [Lissotriton helveticus]